ncbi:hypothetical protein G6F50_014510 [Rhizopus delemar]|uniref:Pyrimidine/purine nucleotide 5'-monophosphate nucleosidase N-terminal domain-containing protein n=1 Tax=Rhizopus delemar TaxID=936053 RepID=A0A9P7C7Z5_9FUNG|nr:hypothetical protein G6F50_014510 [Rhizopus delemar]
MGVASRNVRGANAAEAVPGSTVGNLEGSEKLDMPTNEKAARALPVQDARIYPRGGLDVLSRAEVARLRDASAGGMHELLRRCALAVLTSGSGAAGSRRAHRPGQRAGDGLRRWRDHPRRRRTAVRGGA